MSETGERLAWGWVAHLRDGGTTTWRDWRAAATGAAETDGRYLPGAQQLELLRRLNLAGRPSAELAQRVLAASAPGRGIPDLQLVGASEESAFGPRPIEPTDLPCAELTRVATGLIAEDVVALGTPTRHGAGLPRPWRRRYRLVGDPWLADPIRDELVRRGRPPGGRGSTVYVLGTDLATMLADAWTARSFAEGGPGWTEWLRSFVGSPRVPVRADLVRSAETWSHRVGSDRVEIVLDPTVLPRLVGIRRALPTAPAYSADAVGLARRVGAALGLLVQPAERAGLLRDGLGPRLRDAPGLPLTVPPEHLGWVQRRAVRMRDALLSAGYAVHGDPDALVPPPESGSVAPDDDRVLALALRLLVEPAARIRRGE
ncbi:MAG: hypothetical protein M3237_14975 [Actinomycetota bacterium]|nr:hypothetical protein [Actinomycetota bacterium]